MWNGHLDEILGSDPTAALAYVTPAKGVVLTPVATFGMRDHEARTVTFTTSLGFWRKLVRIEANPRIALFYYVRDHGPSTLPGSVLIRGDASFPTQPDRAELARLFTGQAEPFLGPLKTGLLWDRVTHAYYWVRVPVTVSVRSVDDEPAAAPVMSQPEPAKGKGPRTNLGRAARRANNLGHTVVGYVGPDGYPVVVPVDVDGVRPDGLVLRPARLLPEGGRRAGLLSHRYQRHFTRQAVSSHTGWLEVRGGNISYAPHTTVSYSAPGGTRTLTFAGSLGARVGLASARRRGLVDGERWLTRAERSDIEEDEVEGASAI
jgi:hypothetical protein